MNSAVKYFMVAALAIVAGGVGCRKSHDAVCKELENRISQFSLTSEIDSKTMEVHCHEIRKEMSLLDRNERGKALVSCGEMFLEIKLDEKSYDKRLASIDRYLSLVRKAFDVFAMSADNPDALWKFKLNALRKFNLELEISEIGGNPMKHEVASTGNLLTQYWYRELLRSRRFRVIRDDFENGSFPSYYNGLSDEEKADWLARIKMVAGRDVVIYDPQKPFAPQPRYEPVDERKWLPLSSSGKPREYVERMEDGTTIKMREIKKVKD